MKKLLIVLLIIAFLCCICSVILLIVSEGGPGKILRNTSNGTGAVLLIEYGEVQFKEKEDGEYTEAEDGQELLKGSWVKTGSASEAHLVLEDNSVISLDETTEIEISKLATREDNSTLIKQFLGNTWHRVVNENGGDYEVETPNTIAAVRGTIFGVMNDDDTDNIFSIEDNIELNEAKTTRIQKLTPGNMAVAGKGAEIYVREIPEELKETDWFKRNEQLDKYLKEIGYDNFNSREDFLDKFKENSSEGSILENIQYAPNALDDVSSLSEMQPGDPTACANINAIDINSLVMITNYINQYISLGVSGTQVRNLYNDATTACSDGELNVEEHEELQDNYPFLNN